MRVGAARGGGGGGKAAARGAPQVSAGARGPGRGRGAGTPATPGQDPGRGGSRGDPLPRREMPKSHTHRPGEKCWSCRRRGEAEDLAAAVPARPRPGRPSPAVRPRGAPRRCFPLRAPGWGVRGDAGGGLGGFPAGRGAEEGRPRGSAARAPPRPLPVAGAREPDAVRGRKMHHGMNPSPGDGFLQQQQPPPPQPPPPRRLLAAVLGIQLALCFGPAQLTGGE